MSDKIEMTMAEVEEARATGDFERYRDLRFAGESHNMAIILAAKRGPTGIVRDTDHPCPNKGGR